MFAQGLGELLDPNYADIDEVRLFTEKQQSLYFVLAKKVKTATGKRIVQREKTTRNAQKVLHELIHEGMNSTKAVLTGRNLFTKITTSIYDPSKSMTAVHYISNFEKLVEAYNDQQQDPDCMIRGMMLKNLLQNAFSGIPYLRDVAAREQEMAVRGFPMFDYEAYKALLESAATVYDETKVSRSRSVNVVDAHEENADETNETSINVMKGKVPGSTMNKETWTSIDKNDQAIWDQLQDATKKKVLQYASDRARKKATTGKVNQTSVVEPTTETSDEANDEQDLNISDDEFKIMKTEINDVIGKARKEAHPADVRRMMGKKNAQVKFTKIVDGGSNAQVKFTKIVDGESDDDSDDSGDLSEILDQYWYSDDEDFHRGD